MKRLSYLILFVLSFVGCKHHSDDTAYQHQPANGVYYWRTTFNVSEAEQTFLREHNIKRLYLHLFDVDMAQRNLWENTEPQPVATILFRDTANLRTTLQEVDEVVPTVFLTVSALSNMHGEKHTTEYYARCLTTRILNMCSYHGFRQKVHEVQIDCDWTASTEELYFQMLSEVKKQLESEHCLLSVTIRLHQLRTAAPPADRGMLMVYNTGSFKNTATANSILSFNDAAPYLKKVDYPLPLDYAFPAFGWGIWFQGDKFQAILHEQDYSDTTLYQPSDNTHYKVIQQHFAEGHQLQKGDIIRRETSDMNTIEQLKTLLPFSENKSIILYHLDENNLKNYSNDEIQNLYSRPSAE